MKLEGNHKFKVSSTQVYQAILNPDVLKASIPGCEEIKFLDAQRIQVNITTGIPGLRGPYAIVISIMNQQAPNYLELQVLRQGRGGKINAISQIRLIDELGGSLLHYTANAELEGPVSIANNPLGQGVVKKSISSFFENLEKSLR